MAQPVGLAGARPTITVPRIDASQAPEIDGDLSDPIWARAEIIDGFGQLEPRPGDNPTERTIVRIMYDENNFYFNVYAYDSEPDQIIVRTMERDGEIFTGDNVGFYLDPGPTRRDAYSFQFGPSGGRNDSLILNNNTELDEWDPIWILNTRRVPDGWVAEIAIPFRSLSYEEGESEWGFDVTRDIPRKLEEIQWANRNPALNFTDVSQGGTLTGINNVNRGMGLDIQVYGVSKSKHDWHIPGDEFGISGTAGGNAFYKITSSLTGTLTFNPDFSDAPLDARQVNTTRFSLFFPETRDFFLQDAGTFEFGGRGFARGFGNDRAVNNGRPFFSRNIGLVDGQSVSIIGGGKLSGEHGGFRVGALSVLTGNTPTTQGQVLSVARVTRPVFGESRFGFIVTNGDPTGATDNTLMGGDFQFRNTSFLGNQVIQADAFFQRSFSSTLGDDNSFGASLALPNQPWGGEINFKQIGENFEPALGFLNRTAFRSYEAGITHLQRFQDSWIQQWEISTEGLLVTNLDNHLESAEAQLFIQLRTRQDNSFEFEAFNAYENIPEAFDIADDIIIPANVYNWTNFGVEFETTDNRSLAFGVGFECCSLYNGNAISTEFGLNYRPNAFFEFAGDWELTMLELPSGSVDIHVVTGNAVINFTPNMNLVLQAQWDNISSDLGFLARYRWLFLPGSELFVAFGQGAVLSNRGITAQRSELSVRIGHTFRL
ncbi:MAG: carbohydrate binding family 9 domain-containing protein [Alphaproteobacteria bacterium]